MIHALIIEDDIISTELLNYLLDEYCREHVKVIGSARTVLEGLRLIDEARPDLVFLNVGLDGETGFDLLRALRRIDFEIVFTTGAFQEYAVLAFRFGAVDFLIKPVDPNQLVQAVGRAVANRAHAQTRLLLETLLHKLNPAPVQKLAIPYQEKQQPRLRIVEVNQVLYFEADGSYTYVVLVDGSEHQMSNPLAHYSDFLENDFNFFKTHKSYLINLAHVKAVDQGRGGMITLLNNKGESHDVPVSYQNKSELLRRLKGGKS